MIYVGMLLHQYQPPNQIHEVFERITEECYKPLFTFVRDHPLAKFTMNLNWSLTEQFLRYGHKDLLDILYGAYKNGKVEFTASAAYHAILPLISEDEQERQIELQLERHREIWSDYAPKGFFPPEMAYGPEILNKIKENKFQWLITDDIPYNCVHKESPFNYIPQVEGVGILLRSSYWSNLISFGKDSSGKKYSGSQVAMWMEEQLSKWFRGENGYVIIAMDSETFGHHNPGYIEPFFVPFLEYIENKSHKMRMAHLSEIFSRFPKLEREVPPGSWSTSAEDFWNGNFFPLWKNKNNQVHHLLWQLTELALEGVDILRDQMDRSLNSCTFWWAAVDPSKASPITVSGIDMLMDVVRIANPSKLDKAKTIKDSLDRALSQPTATKT